MLEKDWGGGEKEREREISRGRKRECAIIDKLIDNRERCRERERD